MFLMIGINDLHRNVQAYEITANVERVIGALAKHGIPTVVQSTLLTDKSHKVLNEKVIEFKSGASKAMCSNGCQIS